MPNLKLYTDGGSRGNPGHAAFGFVVYSGAGKVLEKCGNYLGVTTNNQAEYKGLIAGLEWILNHKPDSEVNIFMDSLLIVSQIKGEYKVKHPEIIPLYRQVISLASRLPKYSISYVPRAQNAVADALVNEALDARSL